MKPFNIMHCYSVSEQCVLPTSESFDIYHWLWNVAATSWLKLAKMDQKRNFSIFFLKSLIFECNYSKTVWDVFHDLKNVKIAEKVFEIR
jgi:hypothetical protein